MREQIEKHTILSGILVAVLAGMIVIFACRSCTSEWASSQTETVVTPSNYCWLRHTFESASDTAVTIVYGEVTGRKETTGCATVDVIEWLKGGAESDEITFLELKGEIETQIGESYVFFLNQYGACLSPWTIVHVVDGEISTSGALFPEAMETMIAETEADTVPVSDYLEAIRNICS